jgi:hypothetical protein
MCTNIATKTRIAGSAKTASGWTAIDEAYVGFDHATHAWVDHAVRIDFTSTSSGDGVAVEMDLASGKALLAQLGEVIAAAEQSGVAD